MFGIIRACFANRIFGSGRFRSPQTKLDQRIIVARERGLAAWIAGSVCVKTALARLLSGNDDLKGHPRLMNERAWFGKIVASYKFTSGGSDAISTATFATSAASIT